MQTDLQIVWLGIEKVHPYPANAKTHSDLQVQQVADSIRAFGFNQPIVIDTAGVIIVGHGRYRAATEVLNMGTVPCVTVTLTEDEAKAYRLADNKLNESPWDMPLVLQDLQTLSPELHRLTGFGPLQPIILDDINLPNNEKSEFEQITFTLHTEQAFLIKEAMRTVKEEGLILDTTNENSNGNAIYTIVKQWLEQRT